jgi:hypothetical protein
MAGDRMTWLRVVDVDWNDDSTWCIHCRNAMGILLTDKGPRLACTICDHSVRFILGSSQEVAEYAKAMGSHPLLSPNERPD